MSAKQAINDNLPGSVAAFLRCGGIVSDKIKKGLLLSLHVSEFFFRIGEYLAVTGGGLVRRARQPPLALARNFANYSLI